MRNVVRRLEIGFGVGLLLVLTAGSCDKSDKDVSVGTAARGTVTEVVEASGVVTARAAATVSAPAAGTLTQLKVDAGDRVARNQIIAVVDSPELRARRDAARKALDAAKNQPAPGGGTAGFGAAQRRTDRQAAKSFEDARDATTKISDPNLRAALLKQVDAAEKQYASASATAGSAVRSLQHGVASLNEAVGALAAAQRVQAQQAYDLADAAVKALTLRAPVAGVVQLGGTATTAAPSLTSLLGGSSAPGATGSLPGVDDAIPQGGYVAAGTPVVTIVDADRLGLSADVDETDVLLVKAGVQATVELDAVPDGDYTATVHAVDLLPTTSARGGVSYKVRLDLARATSRCRGRA